MAKNALNKRINIWWNEKGEDRIIRSEKRIRKLTDAINKSKVAGLQNTAQHKKYTESLVVEQARLDKLNKAYAGQAMSYNKLSQYAQKLRREIKELTPGTNAFIAKTKELKIVSRDLDKINAKMRIQKGFWEKTTGTVNKYFTTITAGIAMIAGIGLGLNGFIQHNAKVSDSIADVMKTTQMTKDEVKELYNELSSFDTRSARMELMELGRIAGKLGVTGKEEVLGFIRAADQINVALSQDLGDNVEETIRQIGKLNETYKLSTDRGMGLEEGLTRIGSSINALGAASTANEPYIVDFTTRLAGIAPAAGISIENIMGLGAGLDQLGQRVETSATVFMKLLPDMYKNTAEYANVAGMSIEEFNKLLNEDANEAMLVFLEGLNGNNEGLGTMANKLDDLGIDGARAIGVLSTLSNNIDLVRESQMLSNEEFEKGTSLSDEFNIKNNNLAAVLEKLGKKMRGIFINSGMVDFLERTVIAIYENIEGILKGFSAVIKVLVSITAGVITYKAGMALLNMKLKENIILTKLNVFWEKTRKGALLLSAGAQALFTGNTVKANAAMKLFNKTTKLNPFVLLASVIIAAGVALYKFSNRATQASKVQAMLTDLSIRASKAIVEEKTKLGLLLEIAKDETKSKQDRNAALKRAIEMAPENLKNLTLENINTKDGIGLIETYIDLLEKKAKIRAAEEMLYELEKERLELMNKDLDESLNFWNKIWNGIKSGGNAATTELYNVTTATKKLTAAEEEYYLKRKKLTDFLKTDDNIPIIVEDPDPDPENPDSSAAVTASKKLGTNMMFTSPDEFDQLMQQELDMHLAKAENIMQAEKDHQEAIRQVKKEYGLMTEEEVTIIALEKLGEFHQKGLISEENYQKAKLDIQKNYAQQEMLIEEEKLRKRMEMLEVGTEVFSNFKSVELSLAGDNAKAQKEINKRYAIFELLLGITKIITSTQLANMKSIEASPLTFGQPWVTYNNIMGASAGAALAAEKIKVMQMRKGGYTNVIGMDDGKNYNAKINNTFKGGFVGTPTLLVGEREKEFVINGDSLQVPAIARIANMLNAFQTKQMAEGGFTQSDYENSSSDFENFNQNKEILNEIKKSIDTLNGILKHPIVSLIRWSQNDTLNLRKEINDVNRIDDDSFV